MSNNIASGSIELVPVNSAPTISMSPDSFVFKADYDGGNPQLDNATSKISVALGERQLQFTLQVSSLSVPGIAYSISKPDATSYSLTITNIPTDILEGFIEIQISIQGFQPIYNKITFNVMREASMLDWIQDWDSNKTEIGGTYFISPKIFVGKKTTVDGVELLTGTYIGPGLDGGTGLYGYNSGEMMFKLDGLGGSIGGWNITPTGLESPTKNLKISSSGLIRCTADSGAILWEISESGQASFAKGNVMMYANGSASFKGQIVASSGKIGEWAINSDGISSKHTLLLSGEIFSGLYFSTQDISTTTTITVLRDLIASKGGICLAQNGINSVFEVYTSNAEKVVAFGTNGNFIAGWNFDQRGIYTGAYINSGFTEQSNHIVLGTNGLRGYKWRLEADGSGAFGGGNISWNTFGEITMTAATITNGGSLKVTGNGEILVSNNNNGYGWKLSSGEIAHTSTKLKLTADGSLSIPSSLNLLVEGENIDSMISLKSMMVFKGINLLAKGAFQAQQDLNYWNVNMSPTYNIANIGGYTCLFLSSDVNGGGLWRSLPNQYIQLNNIYTVSFDLYKTSSSPNTLRIGLEGSGVEGNIVDISSYPTEQWIRVSKTQKLIQSSRSFVIYSHTDNSTDIYIKNVKIEVGSDSTDYSEAEEDQMYATGIDILNKKMIFTSNNSIIQTNSGEIIAMFIEKDGRPLLQAANIDVDNLTVKHLNSADGSFRGELRAATGSFSGAINATSGRFIGGFGSPYIRASGGSTSYPSLESGMNLMIVDASSAVVGVVLPLHDNLDGVEADIMNVSDQETVVTLPISVDINDVTVPHIYYRNYAITSVRLLGGNRRCRLKAFIHPNTAPIQPSNYYRVSYSIMNTADFELKVSSNGNHYIQSI